MEFQQHCQALQNSKSVRGKPYSAPPPESIVSPRSLSGLARHCWFRTATNCYVHFSEPGVALLLKIGVLQALWLEQHECIIAFAR